MESPTKIWEEILDNLETQLRRAELFLDRLDADTVASWSVPQPGVPMPRYLVARAQGLLERQQRIIDQIPLVMAATRSQMDVTSRFGGASSGREGSIYVDVSA